MNIKIQNCVFLCLIAFLASCSAPKEVLYLQDIASIKEENIDKNYEVIIHKDDLLAILVNSKDPELALPFNMPVVTYQIGAQTTAQQRLLGYLVDQNGDIDFPILGKLHLGGLTKGAAETVICERLKAFLKEEPIVNVRMVNYKFSVLGEVGKPNTFTVANEKVNVFEALAMAGDMTIYGKRNNVKLLREDEQGRKEIVLLDLKDPGIVSSPYYYLQQNDILYVEPRKSKIRSSEMSAITPWVSILSVLTSLTSLAVALFK